MSLTWTPASDDDPEFTVTTATQHSVLAGRSTADAHPASAITTDNDWNGNLTSAGTNLAAVLDVIDDLALGGGAVDSVNGETGTVVLDAQDVDAVPITAVGLLAGETNRGDWSGATAYAVGDVVHDHAEGQVYVCTAANTNEQPSLTPAKWTAIDGTGRTLALGPGGSAGLFAASLGYGAGAGAGATAIGYAVSAPGFAATAVGYTATAAGAAATAAGSTAAAGGDSSTAVGANATSPGDYSTAIGYGATAPTDGDVNIANILTGHIDTGTGQADEAITVVPGAIDLPETADATNPAAGSQRLVARTDGLYVRDETGAEVGPIGSGGSGIPATIIDAAGDLIVGTAADTAGRLALGPSGQVLTSNGTTAAWAAGPILVKPRVVGGHYNAGVGARASTAHGMTGAGVITLIPQYLHAGGLDRIYVTTTGAAVATWRLGIYPAAAATGNPDGQAPLVDAGTVDMNATPGDQTKTITVTVTTAGLYYLAVLVDAHTATATTWTYNMELTNNSGLLAAPMVGVDSSDFRPRPFRTASGVTTGAMPATCPATTSAVRAPVVTVRYS